MVKCYKSETHPRTKFHISARVREQHKTLRMHAPVYPRLGAPRAAIWRGGTGWWAVCWLQRVAAHCDTCGDIDPSRSVLTCCSPLGNYVGCRHMIPGRCRDNGILYDWIRHNSKRNENSGLITCGNVTNVRSRWAPLMTQSRVKTNTAVHVFPILESRSNFISQPERFFFSFLIKCGTH